jgi:hypothetical protein
MMNSHCQSESPATPSKIDMTRPEIGAPIA